MAGRGRPAKRRGIAAVRELTPADIARLDDGERGRLPAVQRFRDSHHWIARLVALGMRVDDIAERTGYSHTRLYTITSDPAFKELVVQKRETVDESYREEVDDYWRLATSNMMKAERMIGDKLDKADEEGELPPMRDLVSVSRDAADRFGYGKRSLSVNLDGKDFAAALERANQRSSQVIEGTVKQVGTAQTNPSRAPNQSITVPSPLRRRA